MTVFAFKIWYKENCALNQVRYVLARTEAEAFEKMELYRLECLAKHMADFFLSCSPTVEIENVIV